MSIIVFPVINGLWSPHSSVSHWRQQKITKKGNEQNLNFSCFPVPKQGCCWQHNLHTVWLPESWPTLPTVPAAIYASHSKWQLPMKWVLHSCLSVVFFPPICTYAPISCLSCFQLWWRINKGKHRVKKPQSLYDCHELCHILALGFAVSTLILRKVVVS